MAPKHPCLVCQKAVRTNSLAVSCDMCDRWSHIACGTGISRIDYVSLIADADFSWTCEPCRPVDLPLPSVLSVTHVAMDMSEELNLDHRLRLPTPTPPPADRDLIPMSMDDFDDSILDYPPPPRPDALSESSIADPDPVNVNVEVDTVTTYQVVTETSTQGKDKVFDSKGYSYTLKRRTNVSSTWRCSYRSSKINCPATVRETGDEWIPGRDHTHEPTPGGSVAASIIATAKIQAKNNPFQSAQEIANDLVHENVPPNMNCPALPAIDRIAAAANHHQRLTRPKHPTDVDFEFPEGHLPTNYLRDDIRVDKARHLIFATDAQLSLLQKAKTWYVDATFKVVRRPFTQLLTVNAFVRHDTALKQLPLIMCIMTRRRKEDYTAVMESIKNMLEESRLQRFVLDFEDAMWRALDRVFPQVERKGCAFHFAQALWRHIQDEGLQHSYTKDEGTYKFLRKVMALCYIPAQHIAGIFQRLVRESPSETISKFLTYVDRTWIASTIWPPASWSVYHMSIRTNNDLEGWHNRLNSRGRPQMNLYTLISLLFDESSLVPTQVRLVSDNKLRRCQRKSSRVMEARIHKLWSEYEDGEKSAIQLLRAASRLYGPRV